VTAIGDLAATAESYGFDGLWVTETSRSPYTLLTLAGEHTRDIDDGSAIAVAFPRSSMVTAYTAWDLQELTGGRMILGLGA